MSTELEQAMQKYDDAVKNWAKEINKIIDELKSLLREVEREL